MLSTEQWMRDVATRRAKRDEERRQLANETVKLQRVLRRVYNHA